MDIKELFKHNELIPAIIQELTSGEVLMLAYMNEESLRKTIETEYTWFYSRSRKELWNKGATSGNVQKIYSITPDCDNDTLLVIVEQTGDACHTGNHTCFFREGEIFIQPYRFSDGLDELEELDDLEDEDEEWEGIDWDEELEITKEDY